MALLVVRVILFCYGTMQKKSPECTGLSSDLALPLDAEQ